MGDETPEVTLNIASAPSIVRTPLRALFFSNEFIFWRLKNICKSNDHGKYIIIWNCVLFCISVVLAGGLQLDVQFGAKIPRDAPPHVLVRVVFFFLMYIALNRCFEILRAFYRDARARMEGVQPSTTLGKVARIKILFLGYIELIVLFGILQFIFQKLGWATILNCFENISDVIYFSGATITTVGYGDLNPTSWLTRITALFEALSGMFMFAVALGAYLSSS